MVVEEGGNNVNSFVDVNLPSSFIQYRKPFSHVSNENAQPKYYGKSLFNGIKMVVICCLFKGSKRT